MTELTVHTINARARFVEGPGGWCALHPTRARVAMAQGACVYNEPRAAAVFDLRHMRTTAAWQTDCETQRLYWAGERLLELAEVGREQASDGYRELIVRELPDGGEVAQCEVDGPNAPQASHDGRSVYVPEDRGGALRELPGLDAVGEVRQLDRVQEHWRGARLHPDGHCVGLLREDPGSWQFAVRAFAGAGSGSGWYAFPKWASGRVEEVSVQWIAPRAVVLAIRFEGSTERRARSWLQVLEQEGGVWIRRDLIDASVVGGAWAHRHDVSAVHGLLAAVTYADEGAAMALCVIDPRSGRLKAHRPWDANDGAPSALCWMDAHRIALLSLEGDAHGLYLWDLRTDTIRQRTAGLGEVAQRFAYCGFREGCHVLRPESARGRRGVLLIEDTGELSPNERAPAR